MDEKALVVILIAMNIIWFVALMKLEKSWHERMNDINNTWFQFFNRIINGQLYDAKDRIAVLEEKIKELENGKESKDGLQ